jgi:hypothetical protein
MTTESGSKTLRQPATRVGGDNTDDRVAHIVHKDQQMRGYVEGEAIKALCGKVWVPSRDPQGLPICQACVEERDRRVAGMTRMN